MKERSIKLIVFGLFTGALIGTLIGNAFTFLLPEGAVKEFFLISYDLKIGSTNSDYLIDLGILIIDFGFIFKINVCSIIGFGIAYYLLKYFR